MSQDVLPITPFARLLLGLVTAGFLAWAGVVWHGVATVEATAMGIQKRLERIDERVEHLMRSQDSMQREYRDELKSIRKEIRALVWPGT